MPILSVYNRFFSVSCKNEEESPNNKQIIKLKCLIVNLSSVKHTKNSVNALTEMGAGEKLVLYNECSMFNRRELWLFLHWRLESVNGQTTVAEGYRSIGVWIYRSESLVTHT